MQFPILYCPTPKAWIQKAVQSTDLLLVDHAHCEKKAALTALSLIGRYNQNLELVERLSKLAREELRHFEQVIKLLKKRGLNFDKITPSNYARGLFQHVNEAEPYRLRDVLIIGALIEARSCERFSVLIGKLDDELSSFYAGLMASEARHYEMYLHFARQYGNGDFEARLDFFSHKEQELIEGVDSLFRFHSGLPSE
jgi:tRNA-(ms[2]io[6]A)-hydroxylase